MAYYTSEFSGEEIDARLRMAGEMSEEMQMHMADQSNPHGETLAQVGGSNRNLLDNWDFRNPVNQRGAFGTITTGGYFFDRWILVRGSATIHDNGITLNGTIVQISEQAWGGDCTASIKMTGGTASIVYDDAAKTITVTSSGGSVAAAKLELGSVSTLANDPPADYGEELRKCQRYFFRQHFNQYQTVALGYQGLEWLTLAFGIGTQMRVTAPVVTMTGTLAIIGAQASAPITAFTMCETAGCTAILGVSVPAVTPGACYAYPDGVEGVTISLSADL